MDRAEAIEYIQEWLKDKYALNEKDRVVLNMAIEALQESIRSEPKEIPFNEWLTGFLEKECQPERTGGWIVYSLIDEGSVELECPECGDTFVRAVDYRPNFCENCGADMRGETNEDNNAE